MLPTGGPLFCLARAKTSAYEPFFGGAFFESAGAEAIESGRPVSL